MKKLAVGALAACVAAPSLATLPLAAPPFRNDITVWTSASMSFSQTPPAIDGAVGDINGDGRPDIVTVSGGSGSPLVVDGMVALGLPNGTYSSPISFPWRATGIAIADFDDDGIGDVVIVSDTGAWLFRSANGGVFSAPVELHTPSTKVRSADINGDGLADLVLIDGDEVSVRLRTGPAIFGPPQLVGDGAASGVVIGRVNADPAADIVIGSRLYYGRPDGGFDPPVETGFEGIIAIADMNADGLGDLILQTTVAALNTDNGAVMVALNGAEGFTPMPSSRVFCSPPLLAVAADWNGDGSMDLAVGSVRSGPYPLTDHFGRRIALIPGDGAGGLGDADMRAAGGVGTAALLVSDANADGFPDLVTVNRGGRLFVYPQTGGVVRGARTVHVLLNRGGDGPGAIRDILPSTEHRLGGAPVLHDIDGDGDLDFLIVLQEGAARRLAVRMNIGAGRFSELPVYIVPGPTLPSSAGDLRIEDARGTGVRELYVRNWGVLRPTDEPAPGGYFQGFALRVQPAGVQPPGLQQYVIRGDLDGDGIDDYIHWRSLRITGNGFRVTFRRSEYEFETPPNLLPTHNVVAIAVGQFDVNPPLDLAVVAAGPYDDQCLCFPDSRVVLLAGNGDGTFEQLQEIPVGPDDGSIINVASVSGRDPLIVTAGQNSSTVSLVALFADSSGQYRPTVFESGVYSLPVIYRSPLIPHQVVLTIKLAPGDINYMRPFVLEAWNVERSMRRMVGPLPIGPIGGSSGIITPADFDGDGVEDLVLAGMNGGGAWLMKSAVPPPPPPLPPCVGDLNFDRVIDASDLFYMLYALTYQQPVIGTAPPDLNQDGRIDGADLSIFLFRFGRPCP